jgi:hypothetical protein
MNISIQEPVKLKCEIISLSPYNFPNNQYIFMVNFGGKNEDLVINLPLIPQLISEKKKK